MINDKVYDAVNTTDDTQPVYRPRTAEEELEIYNMAMGALGIDPDRGDKLESSTFVFAIQDLRIVAEEKRQAEERDELITAVVLNVGKGIAIIIALLVLRAIIGAIGLGVAREE